MMRGSAATVAGFPAGWLCMRITGCACAPPASARDVIRLIQNASPDPAAFQSSVSTDQFQTRMWRCWARLSVVALYSPYGGRNTHGYRPVIDASRVRCRSISAACPAAPRLGRLWWSQVWSPSAYPAVRSARTTARAPASFTPRLKKVAVTWAAASAAMIRPVSRPGPSSNVSATVLPEPGAVLAIPYGALGQPAIAAAAGVMAATQTTGSRTIVNAGASHRRSVIGPSLGRPARRNAHPYADVT